MTQFKLIAVTRKPLSDITTRQQIKGEIVRVANEGMALRSELNKLNKATHKLILEKEEALKQTDKDKLEKEAALKVAQDQKSELEKLRALWATHSILPLPR